MNSIRDTEQGIILSAFKFIFSIVGTIEYVSPTGMLDTFHFLLPPIGFFLSSETKFQFLMEQIDRTNASSKIQSILDVIPQFIAEMEENMQKYRKSAFQSLLIKLAISPNFHHKQFSILLLILNLIMILLISTNYRIFRLNENGTYILKEEINNHIIIRVVSVMLTIVSFLILLCQLFFRMSIYQKVNQRRRIYNIINQREIFQFFVHFVLSLFGMLIDPLFYYIQSFCFIYISKTMYSVIIALRLRWLSFLGIFTMIMIILNLYGYIGFKRFTTSFQLQVMIDSEQDIQQEEILCDSPMHCFLSLVYLGLRDDSGLGAYGDNESYYKSSDYFPRFMFDFSFFLIITLVMLNIIHGIIIDTFAELRDLQQKNEYDTNNVCLICSLEKWQFEKKGLDFRKHIEETHQVKNYVAFMVHLTKVGKENMNGIETQIYMKMKNKDPSWIPQEKTKGLIE